MGLDIAGLDIVAEDISRPLEEQGGAIVEVNAGPGLQMHVQPADGKPRPVGEAIVGTMFPPGETGRIPLVAVTGALGRTETALLVGKMLGATHSPVGMATSQGVYRDGELVKRGDSSGYDGTQAVLQHPLVAIAVCEVSAASVREEGLGFDSCDVSIVTNVGQDHRDDLSDAETVEQISVLQRCVVEATVRWRGFAVLNADDPTVVGMASYCRGAVIFYSRSAVGPHRRPSRSRGTSRLEQRAEAVPGRSGPGAAGNLAANRHRRQSRRRFGRVRLTRRGGRLGLGDLGRRDLARPDCLSAAAGRGVTILKSCRGRPWPALSQRPASPIFHPNRQLADLSPCMACAALRANLNSQSPGGPTATQAA